MQSTAFRTHLDTPLDVDICWSCHLIWFDNLESVSMSAQSVIDLFTRIHAQRNEARSLVSLTGDCPICSGALVQSFDISRTGRFQYHRCPNGHGRLITFVQFLREKHFVRTLSEAELHALSAKVRQIRCSSCSAGIDIAHDAACTHCGSPVSVLDEAAVAKALADLDQRREKKRAPAQLPSPESYIPRPSSNRHHPTYSTGFEPELVDLLVAGATALLSLTRDQRG